MDVIDEVKSRLDITDVVSETVALRRAGRNFKAPCPFHSERTPSFFVSPDRQLWRCFGACSTGGDVFAFVMKRDGLEFREALRLLAQKAGVTLSERPQPEDEEQHERLVQANEAAAAFFHNALLHSREGALARAYLASRGVAAETVEAFQLGYSPDSWDSLKTHLAGRGFSDEELLAAGLLVESERGGYDRFRGRLIFPIRDDRGRTVGFAGRRLAGEGDSTTDSSGAKYVNSPESPVFHKSRLLYALDRAKEAIRRERSVVVVEGYMDVLAAHQLGRSNVVASMGTALTERQIRALERLKCTILLALDADAAGVEATLRALQEAEAAGVIRAAPQSPHPSELADEQFTDKLREWSRNALKRATVNFYVVPLSGKDPDEMIRAQDGAWDAAVAGARPFTDHVFETVAGRKDLSQPAQRAELLQELLPVVRLIEEPAHRAHYVQRLARLAQVREDVLQAELRRPPRRGRRDAPPAERGALRAVHREPGEEFCLALLLRHPELRSEGLALPAELFLLSEHRALFEGWHGTQDIESLRARLPEELHPHLDRVLARDLPFLEGTRLREALQDCVARIELRRLSAAKQASAAALGEPDVQPYMSAALEQALVLQGAQTAGVAEQASPPPTDPRTSELASTLLEDEAIGRRLHGAARPAEASPQSEGEP